MFQDLFLDTATKRARLALLYAALGAVLLIIGLVDPAGSHFYPPCLFRKFTSLQCPGCGGLRAVHQVLRGHVVAAFRLNPLLMLVSPLIAYAVLSDLSVITRAQPLPRVHMRSSWTPAVLVVIVAFWVLRNAYGPIVTWLVR
jgi:hypothetical protein